VSPQFARFSGEPSFAPAPWNCSRESAPATPSGQHTRNTERQGPERSPLSGARHPAARVNVFGGPESARLPNGRGELDAWFRLDANLCVELEAPRQCLASVFSRTRSRREPAARRLWPSVCRPMRSGCVRSVVRVSAGCERSRTSRAPAATRVNVFGWPGGQFDICPSCERGQRYCSAECSLSGRTARQRRARQLHQCHPLGRADASLHPHAASARFTPAASAATT
jgi:hypothetical protein